MGFVYKKQKLGKELNDAMKKLTFVILDKASEVSKGDSELMILNTLGITIQTISEISQVMVEALGKSLNGKKIKSKSKKEISVISATNN